MLCSAKELELADDVDGLLILDADAPKGASVAEYLRLDDAVLEINVTPNRGDCFSVIGIARELAARRSARLRAPRDAGRAAATIEDTFPISLGAGAGCPRFAGRVLRGLSRGARTPLWMRERLRRAGRSAAATDRRRHELRDARARPADARLRPREARRPHRGSARARRREAHAARRPRRRADGRHARDRGRARPGRVGRRHGRPSRRPSSASTDSVFLESAFFAPAAIVGRPRRLGLHTDASLRFERGVDPTGQVRAIERATELLLAICGGQAGPVTNVERAADLPERPAVALRARAAARGARRRGAGEAGRGDFRAARDESGARRRTGWRVTPPAFRFDIAIEEDLIEEVGRMFGYDAIPATPGEAVERLGVASEHVVEPDDVADLLAARGYAEAITYSFIDPAPGRTREPRRRRPSSSRTRSRATWPCCGSRCGRGSSTRRAST